LFSKKPLYAKGNTRRYLSIRD